MEQCNGSHIQCHIIEWPTAKQDNSGMSSPSPTRIQTRYQRDEISVDMIELDKLHIGDELVSIYAIKEKEPL